MGAMKRKRGEVGVGEGGEREGKRRGHGGD